MAWGLHLGRRRSSDGQSRDDRAGRLAHDLVVDAVAIAQKALELARASSEPKLAGEIEGRLELYRSGRAYRPSIRPSPLTAVTGPRTP
jgi:hypothetical protein